MAWKPGGDRDEEGTVRGSTFLEVLRLEEDLFSLGIGPRMDGACLEVDASLAVVTFERFDLCAGEKPANDDSDEESSNGIKSVLGPLTGPLPVKSVRVSWLRSTFVRGRSDSSGAGVEAAWIWARMGAAFA